MCLMSAAADCFIFPQPQQQYFEVHLTASECIGMQCLCGSLMWALSKIKWWKAKHAMQLVTRYVLEYTKRNQPCSPSACPSGTKTSAFPRPKPRESSAEGGQTEPCPWSQTRPLWSWSGRATKSSIYAWPPQRKNPGLLTPAKLIASLSRGKFLASHFSAWYIPSGELATHEQRPQWSARPGQQGQCEQPTRSATTRPRSEAHAWGWHPPTSNTPPEPKRSYFRQPSYDKGSQCDACRSSARGAQRRRPPPTNAALADLSGAAFWGLANMCLCTLCTDHVCQGGLHGRNVRGPEAAAPRHSAAKRPLTSPTVPFSQENLAATQAWETARPASRNASSSGVE